MALIAGRYELGELIGQGGMGEVYRGLDTRTGMPVAIKVLKPEVIEADPNIVERFAREGEALRRLNHPSIVKVLDTVEENGAHYLIMEYVGGGSLAQLLRKQPQLPIPQILNFALDLSDALTRAHRLKIIHRDIKPANVLIDEDGTPRLTDFGVAHLGDRTRVTQTGSLVGTYAYLSPEACNGEVPDERSDIWAFGVMLFEMLAGKRPFEGDQPGTVLLAIMTKPPGNLPMLRPDAPIPLIELVYQMLEKDKEQRPSSIRLIGAALEAMITGREPNTPISTSSNILEVDRSGSRFATPTPSSTGIPKIATPTVRSPMIEMEVEAPTTLGTTAPVPAASNARSWITLAAVLGVLGLIILGGLFFMMSNNDDENDNSNAPPVITVPPVAPDEFMVLVADLELIGNLENRDPTRFVVDDLKQKLENILPYSNIRVRRYQAVITSGEQAREIAEANDAAVIIWGNATEDLVELNIQIGDLAVFESNPFERKVIADTANVRVHLTDPRQQSAVPYVLTTLMILHSANSDGFEVSRTLIMQSELNIQNLAEIDENNAAAYIQEASRSFVTNPQQAYDSASAALEINPGNPFLYVFRAAALLNMERYDEAWRDLDTAARRAPAEWVNVQFIGANISVRTMNIPQTIAAYDVLVEARPDDWFLWNFKGALNYLMRNYDQAREDYDKSMANHPEANFPYGFAAMIALRQGRMKDAGEYMRTMVREFPDANLSNRMVEAVFGSQDANVFGPAIASINYLALGQYDRALVEVNRSIEIMPGFADAYLVKGVSHCALGQYEEALEAYTQAIRLDPDNPALYMLRASVFVQQNKMAEATQDLQELERFELSEEMQAFVEAGLKNEVNCENFFNYEP